VLALGFGLLTLLTVATTALRSRVILVVQNYLHFQIGARLFHHLLRLPLAWFEKRATSATSCRVSAPSSRSATSSRRG
jgi:ATP-binding cassette, subfamily B, bacterial CvaB/MchF/RaxB